MFDRAGQTRPPQGADVIARAVGTPGPPGHANAAPWRRWLLPVAVTAESPASLPAGIPPLPAPASSHRR